MDPKQSRLPTTVVYLDHTAKLGGGEISLLNLVQQIDRERYTPVVVLGEDGELNRKLEDAGIETHVIELDPDVAHTRKDTLTGAGAVKWRMAARTALYIVQLSWFLKRRGAAILHTNSLKADILGGLAGRLIGVPIIWHVRDRIADDYLPPLATRIFRSLCRILPNYLVVNSQSTLEALQLPRNVNARVVHNGIVERRVRVVHDGFVEPEQNWSDGQMSEPLIGLVGRISPWKGQHIFIRAASIVRERFPHTRFQIIGAALFGETEYEAEVRALATSLDMNECLEWTGFRHDVPELIGELDMLIHASTTGEPFGQVVMEGMVAAKPVVATRGGGIPEIVLDGKTGLLVPMDDAPAMADAIIWMLDNPQRAGEMGVEGRKRVQEHFTIAQTAAKVQRLYALIEADHKHPTRARFFKPLFITAILFWLWRRNRRKDD